MADTSKSGIVIVLSILGAMTLIMCGYAIHRLIGLDMGPDRMHRSNEQEDYMREVRWRNRAHLQWEARPRRGERERV
ncbi:hypothetical protein K469DRAFT_709712 [Zopfia rhizophila CBS 207.26]|uniref:Uncharacterized protein n=1 Tax=Zopfia rhizophila CBS 207.26 TaxID=1314779 RepID=A0A6A6ETT9_9PEZI|nr:hypothetical protein K469DRAFT_709712 [Zopfia rhizophila CBS 207.26]